MKKSEKKEDKPTPKFLKIADTCQLTGLPQHLLRSMCRSGEIETIKSGNTYYINIPRILEQFNIN